MRSKKKGARTDMNMPPPESPARGGVPSPHITSERDAAPGPEVMEDAVTYASWESFPASDPPGWRRGTD